jgi:hypothetical protein
MVYTKPKVVAQNSAQGSYAAGCPEKIGSCKTSCETRK